MSYNLVDPTTGDLTRVAGNSNIVDSAIGINSTWSSKKISADLDNKINKTDITATIDSTSTDTQVPSAKSVYDTTSKFLRTYTSITELGLTVGSETIEDIANSMGDKTRLITLIFEANNNMSIYPYKNGTLIVEKINIYRVNLKFCEDISSNVYVSTYHGEKGFTGWQQLATMDKVAHEVDTSYMSNGVLNVLSIKQSLGVGCYEIMGQGNSGYGSIRLNIWQVFSGSFAFSCCITDTSGVRSICSNDGESPTVDVGTSYFATTNKIIKIF